MPSSRLTVAGVTGTNGKTTCAWLLASAVERLARRGAYLGTLGAGFPPDLQGGALTTPDVISLHRQLRALADAGATHVAIEVSSHALDQRRIDGLRMRVAAFSNLSRDHLDYHGTMERYAEAKARLFRLPGLEHTVINVGDAAGSRFAAGLAPGVELTAVAVGGDEPETARFVHVRRVRAADRGLDLEIRGHFGERRLRSRLIGAFNAENLAVTLGVLLAWQFDVDASLVALGACAAPPGRMEGYRLPNGALAVVDYAHTPDALAKSLAAVRAHARGRVLVVFGCGGERDPGKRAMMGEAAERLADRVIVTDDNPRGEDADRIVAMILQGVRRPERVLVERDRARAIDAALGEACAGDAVLVAGKGHEEYQLVGRERRRFSDRERLA
ncbi:MAG: Mur ligase family protein, partial [Steroidobacteraceae bacterium]